MGSKFLLASFCLWKMTVRHFKSAKVIEGKSYYYYNIPKRIAVRSASGLIPPSQYDTPFPKRMLNIAKHYEVIPLVVVITFAMSIMFFSIYWALNNKVDVSFNHRHKDTISRTMDLMHPTVHKIFTINQKYEPWPEMASILHKMNDIEHKSKSRGCY